MCLISMPDRKRVLCVSFIEPDSEDLGELGKDYGEDAIYVVIKDPQEIYPVRAIAFSNKSFRYYADLSDPRKVVDSVVAEPLYMREDISPLLREISELNDGVVTYELAFRQGVRAIRELNRIKSKVDNSFDEALKIR